MPQPAHRDARHTADRAHAAHELVAIAVGQTNIAYQHIKRPGIGRRCISSLSQTR
jgi:hypothetical protein